MLKIIYIFSLLTFIYLVNIFSNKYFSRPDVQMRRLAKSKLPQWLSTLEFLLFLGFLLGIIVSLVPILNINGIGEITSVYQLLELISFFVCSAIFAMLLSNLVLELVPITRKISNENFKGIPGASFREANKGLIKILFIGLISFVLFLTLNHVFK